jgi:hypothetical protein
MAINKKNRWLVYAGTLVILLGTVWSFAQEKTVVSTQTATGIVFSDGNGNGVQDAKEKGLANVCISNGEQVVKTDAQGRYKIPVTDDCIIFVIKPSGWKTPVNSLNQPQYYYIHKPAGSPQTKYPGVPPTGALPASINFPLIPSYEGSKFSVIFLGDPQTSGNGYINYFLHDIVEEVAGVDAAFVATLGDNGANNLSVYPSLIQAYALLGKPVYPVPGNHDENFDVSGDEYATETYQKFFGPPYYSYNYGKVHFIAMDDVYLAGPTTENYRGYMVPRQLEFIKNDLTMVPKDYLVVLMMHIPLVNLTNKEAVYDLLADRPYTFSISGHTHSQDVEIVTAKEGWKGTGSHIHFINGTACGMWWGGQKDEVGLPHAMMNDGTPNGYAIGRFDGNKFKVEFKAARRPADYQMNIFAPSDIEVKDINTTEVVVNVFAGSVASKVKMRVGKEGRWIPMTQYEGVDPYYQYLYDETTSAKPSQHGPLFRTRTSTHLWKALLPLNLTPGTWMIEVETTDVFGQTYTARRAIRINPDSEPVQATP